MSQKKRLLSELENLTNQSINCTLLLFKLLLPKLVNQIDIEYIYSHQQIIEGISNENVKKYILSQTM